MAEEKRPVELNEREGKLFVNKLVTWLAGCCALANLAINTLVKNKIINN